jgi:hypothetical protein
MEMRALTEPVSPRKVSPRFPVGREQGTRRSCLLSVLCVFEDPLYLDRIRRNLEGDDEIFVENAVQVEDALHLMEYLYFDVVVTNCISWHSEQNGFLKAVRKLGREIPFIYFVRGMKAGWEKEARRFGRVRCLVWDERDPAPPFDRLAQYIHDMVAPGREDGSWNAFGWQHLTGERMA